LTSRCPIV